MLRIKKACIHLVASYITEYKRHAGIYLQEREVNCVDAATLKLAAGRTVCGAAVEGDPGLRRTPQVRL